MGAQPHQPAILHGYEQVRRIAAAERDLLDSAVRFALAFHLGAYLQDRPRVTADGVVLQKMQARFAATGAIARLARAYLAEPR